MNSIRDKRILVTGAAGFIGSNLTDELLKIGVDVIGIDNLFNGIMENLKEALKNPNFSFHKVDIRDEKKILDICKDIDIIYHEAAFVSVPESIKDPIKCNDININGTLNLLECGRKLDIDALVFASSGAVYGETDLLPMKEKNVALPLSPYGASKLACEHYLHSYFKIYGLNTIALRYLNVYGPRQIISPYSGVIAKWIGRINRNEDLIIYGDGEQLRDFIYIKDVIEANLLAATSKDSIGGENFNIGIGNPININYLANIMKQQTNSEHLKIIYTEARIGDIRDGTTDTSKAKKILKFKPKYSIENGIKDYLEWLKEKETE